MEKKVLIVGGKTSGISAAARTRRLDENAKIIIFEQEEYIYFANCGLPYYLDGTIKDKDKLVLESPETLKEKLNIEARPDSEIISVKVNERKVIVQEKSGNKYEETYDYLILSPGAKQYKTVTQGLKSNKIFSPISIQEVERLKTYLDDNNIKRAVILGGTGTTVELAESLSNRKINVTLIHEEQHILKFMDEDLAAYVEKELNDNGVILILGESIRSIEENDDTLKISLAKDTIVETEILIIIPELEPNTKFLEGSDIVLDSKGFIVVDEHMKTNIDNVYAAGWAALVEKMINKKKTNAESAGAESKQGRIAADNIYGIPSIYKGTQSTFILKAFSLTAASTGCNEKDLHNSGIKLLKIYVHPMSHTALYKQASQMTIKLIFSNEGKVLGAQAVGYSSVDKTIDVIAAVIKLGGTIEDLADLELSCGPAFSSANTPVNISGQVAENVLKGLVDTITPSEIQDISSNQIKIIDVRTADEFQNGHEEQAVNIPVGEIRNRLNELDKENDILVYCQIGLRGYIASRILKSKGFKVKNITGGYKSMAMLKYEPSLKKENSQDDYKKDKVVDDMKEEGKSEQLKIDKELDVCGMSCPGPLMEVKEALNKLKDGQVLKATASDPGFYEDIKAWCKKTGNKLVELKKDGSNIVAVIRKGNEGVKEESNKDTPSEDNIDNKTIIVFSGELDKAIAAFIIANGAVAMGKKVTMFFTFWGINILRKNNKIKTNKDLVEKVFGAMMPRGSKNLKLSKMNMAGIGPKMIREIMRKKNVNSLEELIENGINSGIQIVACQMSMDLLGLKKEELIDGVKIGGVGYYLGETEESNLNLFI